MFTGRFTAWRRAFLIAGLALAAACGSAAPVHIAAVPLPNSTAGLASFDVVQIDQANHRLYAADRAGAIDVFDVSAAHGKYLQSISLPQSPNGLALAPHLGRLFAGLADGSVAIVDVKPGSPTGGTVVQLAPTGGKEADLLDYSASNQVVYVSNGIDGTITAMDAASGDVKGRFKVGYALEQPRFDPADRMLYVTSPDADALFKIDPTSGAIKSKIPLGGCVPTGMAINPQTDHALIACRLSVIDWDLRSGSSASFGQVGGGDVVTYDPKADRFFVAVPGRSPQSSVGIFGGNPIDFVSTVVTEAGGNSAAYDETNGVVYTPDIRPNRVGLASFRPPTADEALASVVPTLAPFLGVLGVIALFIVLVGRGADPIRRPMPNAGR